jgi:hypothetical protein
MYCMPLDTHMYFHIQYDFDFKKKKIKSLVPEMQALLNSKTY